MKEKTIVRLSNELDDKKKELEKQDNEYKNLYSANEDDIQKLKNLKNNLYLKIEEILSKNIDLNEGRKIVEEVRMLNDEKTKNENEPKEENEDISEEDVEENKENIFIKIKNKFMNLVNKFKDKNISVENNNENINENIEEGSLRDRIRVEEVENNETIIKTTENITKQEIKNENSIEK